MAVDENATLETERKLQCLDIMTKILQAKPDLLVKALTGENAAKVLIASVEGIRKYIYPDNS